MNPLYKFYLRLMWAYSKNCLFRIVIVVLLLYYSAILTYFRLIKSKNYLNQKYAYND